MKRLPKLPKDYLPKLDFMYTLIQKKLEGLDTAHTALGTKISVLFGFTSATTIFYINLLFQQSLLVCIPRWLLWLRIGGLLGLLATLLFLCLALKIREYETYPHQNIFLGNKPLATPYYSLKLQVLADLRRAFNTNKNILSGAISWFKRALWLLFGSVCLIILSSFIR